MRKVETIRQLERGLEGHRCAAGRRQGLKSIPECLHQKALDLETMVWTRGRDFPLAWKQERLRCPRCGSRRVTLIYAAPEKPVPRGDPPKIPWYDHDPDWSPISE